MAGGAAMAILNLWESCLASCKLPFALAEVCSLMMELETSYVQRNHWLRWQWGETR